MARDDNKPNPKGRRKQFTPRVDRATDLYWAESIVAAAAPTAAPADVDADVDLVPVEEAEQPEASPVETATPAGDTGPFIEAAVGWYCWPGAWDSCCSSGEQSSPPWRSLSAVAIPSWPPLRAPA